MEMFLNYFLKFPKVFTFFIIPLPLFCFDLILLLVFFLCWFGKSHFIKMWHFFSFAKAGLGSLSFIQAFLWALSICETFILQASHFKSVLKFKVLVLYPFWNLLIKSKLVFSVGVPQLVLSFSDGGGFSSLKVAGHFQVVFLKPWHILSYRKCILLDH